MKLLKTGLLILSCAFLMFVLSNTALAATAVNLGEATDFAVLGGTTITNTGSTVVNGDLGLSPGTSVTGFPPGIVSGTQHVTDTVAAQAQIDLTTAYNDASGQTGAVTVSGNLGGLTLVPGVYSSASTLGLTGSLILDGLGNPDAVFIFQISSALTTDSGSSVSLINSSQACNVFWQVGSSATLGTNSSFIGSILALTSITANTGASIDGRVLARNGAVTLDVNSINKSICVSPVVTPPTPTPLAPTLHVIKQVVNNSGGTAEASLFNLHVKLSGVDVVGSPVVGTVMPGISFSLTAGTYNISEDAATSYTASFSGDCDSSGNVVLVAGDNKTCTITNDDIALADETAPIIIPPPNPTPTPNPVPDIIPTPTPVSTPVPNFPDTGFSPKAESSPLNIIILTSIIIALIVYVMVRRKKMIS